MSQNGQTHFKNLAANTARFLNMSDHFGTLCIKGLRIIEHNNRLPDHFALVSIQTRRTYSLRDKCCKIFKVCLTILGYYALKD